MRILNHNLLWDSIGPEYPPLSDEYLQQDRLVWISDPGTGRVSFRRLVSHNG